jgi:hypothetical protein
VLAWLDKQQDTRQLSHLKTLMKTLLTDRYKQIAKDKEMIWKHRAKRNWIKEGDKNTTYFHMVATAKKKQNIIHTLQEGHNSFTEHDDKAQILFQYYCQLMGT